MAAPDATNRLGHRGSYTTMVNVEEIEVVVAHNERATLRIGDVFLKIDADPALPTSRSTR
jgi:hypothetical protein